MAVVIAFQLDAISKHRCVILNEIVFTGAFSPKLYLFSDTNADKRRTNKSVAADNFTVVQIRIMKQITMVDADICLKL